MGRHRVKDPKNYVNENTLHTIKILEALEGTNFEPVPIQTIIDRVGIIPKRGEKLKTDKVMRVLISLELLGWAKQNEQKEWSVGTRILRFSNRYSELCIAALNKN